MGQENYGRDSYTKFPVKRIETEAKFRDDNWSNDISYAVFDKCLSYSVHF